jgi:hypothetical protein
MTALASVGMSELKLDESLLASAATVFSSVVIVERELSTFSSVAETDTLAALIASF